MSRGKRYRRSARRFLANHTRSYRRRIMRSYRKQRSSRFRGIY